MGSQTFRMVFPSRTNDDHPLFDTYINVEFSGEPFQKGRTEAGLQMEPDTPEDFEIIEVTDETGNIIKLTEDETADVLQYLVEHDDDLFGVEPDDPELDKGRDWEED